MRRKPTLRQLDYLRLALLKPKDVAEELVVARSTARRMFQNIMRKYGAATKEAALFLAIMFGDINTLDVRIPMKTERIG